MKTALPWLTNNSGWRRGHHRAGHLVLAGILGLVLFFCAPARAATIRISQEPSATTAKGTDLLLIDINAGGGTYVTKKILLSALADALAGSNSYFFVTNLYVSQSFITNLYVTTNYADYSFETNLFVNQAFITNLYVTTEYVTNLTVQQTLIANKSIFTNVTIISPGGFTNLNLSANSIVMTDDQKDQTSLANGGAHTFPEGTTPPAFRLLQGNDLQNDGSLASIDTTNYVLDLSTRPYQSIHLGGNFNVIYLTNGPGVMSVRLDPNGSDRVLTFPTNWVFLRTNNLVKSGAFWTYTLTNSANGANWARSGVLSVWTDEATGTQNNIIALFQQSP